jgi:hypothetical protein
MIILMLLLTIFNHFLCNLCLNNTFIIIFSFFVSFTNIDYQLFVK